MSRKKKFRILVVGGSAGALPVFIKLIKNLPKRIPFSIVFIIHRLKTSGPELCYLLSQKTVLKVKEAEDKEKIKLSHIYVAPADYHLFIEKDKTLSLDMSEKINFSRPSIDPTFETGAEAYKGAIVGLLLSGASSDGVKGLVAIQKTGAGITIVQDPKTCEAPYLPEQTIQAMTPDYILSPDEIPALTEKLFEVEKLADN